MNLDLTYWPHRNLVRKHMKLRLMRSHYYRAFCWGLDNRQQMSIVFRMYTRWRMCKMQLVDVERDLYYIRRGEIPF